MTTTGNQEALVDEVLAAEAERVRAICESDWAALDAMMTDDVSYIHMPGTMDDKERFLAGYRSRPRTTERRDLKVRVYRSDTAVMTGIMLNTREPGATPTPARVTQTWVKVDGKWKMAAFQATRIQEGHG